MPARSSRRFSFFFAMIGSMERTFACAKAEAGSCAWLSAVKQPREARTRPSGLALSRASCGKHARIGDIARASRAAAGEHRREFVARRRNRERRRRIGRDARAANACGGRQSAGGRARGASGRPRAAHRTGSSRGPRAAADAAASPEPPRAGARKCRARRPTRASFPNKRRSPIRSRRKTCTKCTRAPSCRPLPRASRPPSRWRLPSRRRRPRRRHPRRRRSPPPCAPLGLAVPTAAPTSRATPAPPASIAPSAAPVAVACQRGAERFARSRTAAPRSLRHRDPACPARAQRRLRRRLKPEARPQAPVPRASALRVLVRARVRKPKPLPLAPSNCTRRRRRRRARRNRAADINAKLRSLLPNNPVNPSSKQYAPEISLHGSLEPTPPPAVLAQTKYLYRSGWSPSHPGASEARVEMWVTSIRKAGVTTMCTGWLVRYPFNESAPHPGDFAPANGIPDYHRRGARRPGGAASGRGGHGHRALRGARSWYRTRRRLLRRRDARAFPLEFRHLSHYNWEC